MVNGRPVPAAPAAALLPAPATATAAAELPEGPRSPAPPRLPPSLSFFRSRSREPADWAATWPRAELPPWPPVAEVRGRLRASGSMT